MKKILLLGVLIALVPVPARAIDNQEMLSLVAMPLAVAAVSELTDVPTEPLFELIALLNDAQVPPGEFIEVVRYAPVALVVDAEPDFVDYVRLQTTSGATGIALAKSIETELREYGLPGEIVIVEAPRLVTIDDTFVSPVVRQTIITNKNHPHGGPPGQLKKARGVQTGAEIVHEASHANSRRDGDDDRFESRDRSKDQRKAERKAEKRSQSRIGNENRGNNGKGVERQNRGKDKGGKKGKDR